MSDLNTLVQLLEKNKALQKRIGDVEHLETPATIVARYATNAGQSIPNNAVTIVDFGTLVYDTHSAVTTGAAWHFHAPVNGYYAISAEVMFEATNTWVDGEYSDLEFYKNGVQLSTPDVKTNYPASGGQYMQLGGSDIIYLAANETLDVRVYQGSGAALLLFNNFSFNYVSIHKV
jgi:hypothetical protein